MGNRPHIAVQAQHQRQQNDGAQRPRHRRAPAGTNVDGGSQIARAGQPADDAGHDIGDALPHQLPIGVVPRPRHPVGNQRVEQAVDGAEQSQNHRRRQRPQQESGRQFRQLQFRQAHRRLADDRQIVQPENPQRRARYHRCQRPRKPAAELTRPQDAHQQRYGCHNHRVGVGVDNILRQYQQRIGDAAHHYGRPHKWRQLHHDYRDADARHKPGDHRVRRIGYHPPHPQQAQQKLDDAGHHHDGERLGQVVGVLRYNHRHGDGHRRGRPRNLRPGAAEHRREKPHRNGAVHPGNRPHPGRHAKGQGHRQPHHRRRNAAEKIAAQSFQAIVDTHAAFPFRRGKSGGGGSGGIRH